MISTEARISYNYCNLIWSADYSQTLTGQTDILQSPTDNYLLNMSFESSGNFSRGTSLSLAFPSLMRESQNAARAMMAELRPGFDPDDVSFARFGLAGDFGRGDDEVRFTLEATGVVSLVAGVHFTLDVTVGFSFCAGIRLAPDGVGVMSLAGGAVVGGAGDATAPSSEPLVSLSSWKISSRRLRGRFESGVLAGVVFFSCFNFSRIIFGRSRPVRLCTCSKINDD